MLFVWSSSDFKWKPTHPNNIEYSSQVLAEKSNIQYSNLTMDPNPIIHLQDATTNLTPIKYKLNALKKLSLKPSRARLKHGPTRPGPAR